MYLTLLQETQAMSVYYDHSNDWMFTDWHGELTLPLVQESCLTLAHCFLERPCTHILNNNSKVTRLSTDVPPWLAHEYLPHISVAGVEFLAWVSAPSLLVKALTGEAVSGLGKPVVALFDDLAEAYDWLQRTRFHQADDTPMPSLAQRKANLAEKLAMLSSQLERYRQGQAARRSASGQQ